MSKIISVLFFTGIIFGMFSCQNEVAEKSVIAEKRVSAETTEVLKPEPAPVEEVADSSVNEQAKTAITEIKEAKPKEKTSHKNSGKIPIKKKKKLKAPIIAFEQTSHNFGTVPKGELVSHQFFFENKGTKSLLIKDATATCGCTVPSFPKMPIEPGEVSSIRISFNTKAKEGAQKPVVTVYTNARKKPYKLYLEGNISEESENDKLSQENEKDGE